MKLLIILTLIIFLTGCNSLKNNQDINSIELKNNNSKNIIDSNNKVNNIKNINNKSIITNKNINPTQKEINNKQYNNNNIINSKTTNNEEIIKQNNNYNSNIIKLDKLNYNSNISNLLEFYGENLKSIDYIIIGGKKIKGIIKNDYYYIGIDKNTFKSSTYNVIILFKDGTKLDSNLKIHFNYTEKSINISNITPNTISNKEDTFIILQGNGFKKIISVQFNNNVIIKDTSFKVINDNVASIRIDAGLKPGKYFFNIMHTKGINKLSNINFNITN